MPLRPALGFALLFLACDDGSPVVAPDSDLSLADAYIESDGSVPDALRDGAPADLDDRGVNIGSGDAEADVALVEIEPAPPPFEDGCGDGVLVAGEFCPGPGATRGMRYAYSAVWAGDADGDGRPDLAWVSAGGELGVRFNNGRRLEESPPHFTRTLLIDVVGGDFDCDGDVDFATASVTDREIRPFWRGSTDALEPGEPTNIAGQPFGLEVGDLDEDGCDDVVAANFSRGGFTVLRGRPDGRLGVPEHHPTGIEPHGAHVADIDGDGHLDVLVANAGTHDPAPDHITLSWGRGDGRFDGPLVLEVGNGPFHVGSGDFDHDGDRDLVACNFGTPIAGSEYSGGDTISVLRNLGGRRFGKQREIPAGNGPNRLVVADVNADGHLDVLTADRGDFDFGRRMAVGGGDVTVLFGDGRGLFPYRAQVPQLGALTDVTAADFDDDGLTDFAAAVHDANVVGVHIQEP